MNADKIQVMVTYDVTVDLLANLMVTVIETPCGEWLRGVELTEYKSLGLGALELESPAYADQRLYLGSTVFEMKVDHEAKEGDIYTSTVISREHLLQGLHRLAAGHPSIFARLIDPDGDWDAGDADVWFQYVILGEEVFG